MAVQEPRPNHTIYINNLNEKIKKDGEGGLGGSVSVTGVQAVPCASPLSP